MNRGDRRQFMRQLERTHLELGRAYEHVLQLRISRATGDRMDDAMRRLHKAESKITCIRAAMRRDDEEQNFLQTA